MSEYEELYNRIRKELFATLCELQNTNHEKPLKEYLQIKLSVCYDFIGDTLDDEWHETIARYI